MIWHNYNVQKTIANVTEETAHISCRNNMSPHHRREAMLFQRACFPNFGKQTNTCCRIWRQHLWSLETTLLFLLLTEKASLNAMCVIASFCAFKFLRKQCGVSCFCKAYCIILHFLYQNCCIWRQQFVVPQFLDNARYTWLFERIWFRLFICLINLVVSSMVILWRAKQLLWVPEPPKIYSLKLIRWNNAIFAPFYVWTTFDV